MWSPSTVSRFSHLWPPFGRTGGGETAINLSAFYHHPALLPAPLRQALPVQQCLPLLGPLAWEQFSERDLQRNWGQPSTPYAAFAAACLWHLEQHLGSLAHLHRYLGEQPELAWVLCFRPPEVCRNALLNPTPVLPDRATFRACSIRCQTQARSSYSPAVLRNCYMNATASVSRSPKWSPSIRNTSWPGCVKITPKPM